jgi:hypothetical protein
VAPEPAVGGGVELDVAGLGELRVRVDTQARHAGFQRGVIERTHHHLHLSDIRVTHTLTLIPLAARHNVTELNTITQSLEDRKHDHTICRIESRLVDTATRSSIMVVVNSRT